MADWTWKQTVADAILEIVNSRHSLGFTLSEVYEFEGLIQTKFPNNNFVKQKIRQVLQQLRDLGFLTFSGDGNYQLNPSFSELEFEPLSDFRQFSNSTTKTVVRNIRLRNTLLAFDVKDRYQNICQVCRNTVELRQNSYAEAHHIRPLGTPHLGPDNEGNILVVCPNHHVMLDRGAISIDPESLLVKHIREAFEPRELLLADWHQLDRRSLDYYSETIYGKA